ncbi:MAG: thioredoxin [Chitinophagales bacterium]|nr:thioredoxin [Chitinophagales bacterium]
MAKGNLKMLINQEKPVLVDFFATWCGPCKAMQPILEDVVQKAGAKVKVIKIDIDKNPRAAQQFGVRSVPTLILFKEGQIKWRQSGVVPSNQIIQQVNRNV